MILPPTYIERGSFAVAVISGIVGAVAGGSGWPITAIVAGCLAAAAPIAGRFASQSITRKTQADADIRIALANARADEANRELDETQNRLASRSLTNEQIEAMRLSLSSVDRFSLTVAHNRREAEPETIFQQIYGLFKEMGFDTGYYGGMTNTTRGIEVSGPDGPEKQAVMNAFNAGGVDFLPIYFSDDEAGARGIEVWVGVHPGLSKLH